MAVAFDAASNIIEQVNVSSFSWSHTTGSGSDRVLMVGVGLNTGSVGNLPTVSGVTYAGVAMTSVGTADDGVARSHLWRLVNPASGTNTVAVTLSGTVTYSAAGAVSVTGAHQTTPTGTYASAVGTSGGPSVAVSSATDELVIDCPAADAALTVGAGQTSRWNVVGNRVTAGSTEPGAASVTMSWSADTFWVTGGVSIKEATAAVIKGRVLMAPYFSA